MFPISLKSLFDALAKCHDPHINVFSDQENHAGVQANEWNCINKFADSGQNEVSLLGVDSLWGDCMFIPSDWGS